MESSHKSNLPVADKSCPVSSTPVEKLQIHESQRLDAHFVSPVLEKTKETLNSQVNKDSAELPEKKFSYKDLAQIKFILPEAVQIEK
ncbi:hypothetical protein Tco_0187687, partial [Tanacetum coccineum]